MEDKKTAYEFISDTIKELEGNVVKASRESGKVFSAENVVYILENLRKWIVELGELAKEQ